MRKYFAAAFLTVSAIAISPASAEVRCEYKIVTEESVTGHITTSRKQVCVERTINGRPTPIVPRVSKVEPTPGCYKRASDGYIVADPRCPAWIAYLRGVDQRNGLVPYSTRNHYGFKRDTLSAFLTVIFAR
jgi:hypothetical protein